MQRIDFLRKALAKEPETSLEYLLGTYPGRYDDIVSKPYLKGYFVRSLRLLYKTIRQTRPSSLGGLQQAPVFFYAGTTNQLKVLLPVAERMDAREFSFVARKGLRIEADVPHHTFHYPVSGHLIGLAFLVTRGASLYCSVRGKLRNSMRLGADHFFRCYFDIPRFYELLQTIKPDLVVVANDHNPDTRSLLLTARLLQMKTVYLQHAAVNEYFPPLEVDYAFLDGPASLVSYGQALERHKEKFYPAVVLLSGQKKKVKIKKSGSGDLQGLPVVGASLNRLDSLEVFDAFVMKHLNGRCALIVRPHPGDVRRKEIAAMLQRYDQARYSDSRAQSVDDFLSLLDIQLAGNSSIHLEAILSNTASYYCDFGGNFKGDHYGFSAAGLIKDFPGEDLTAGRMTIRDLEAPPTATQVAAARHYSSTYMTEWYGREGQLVARTLRHIASNGEVPKSLYRVLDTGLPYDVYDLRSSPGTREHGNP